MDDEYDVFGDLDAVCNTNLLANYRKTVSCVDNFNDNSEDDLENSLEILLSSTNDNNSIKERAEVKKSKPKSSKSAILPENPTELPARKTRSSLSKRAPNELRTIDEPTQERRLTRSSNRTTVDIADSTDPHQPEKATANRRGRGGRKKKSQVTDQPDTVASNGINGTNEPTTNPIQRLFRDISTRHLAAMRAAESTNVEYVDLVSSPVPRIEGVITLDSDTEETPETGASKPSLDLSFDEENPEISVKVIWNGKLEIFKQRKYQKFGHIFSTIAQREGTEETNLVFNINNKIINSNDTPASIDYRIYQFINGRIMASKFNSPVATVKKRDVNKILLKIQSDQWKRPLQIEVLKTEKFKILYIKCAEELNIPYDNLKLSFDGETLEFDDTPALLDLEGGEAIDLRIKK